MTKKGIIYETLGRLNDLTLLESSTDGEVRLSGVFGVCGIRNGNNRIYEKSNYGKMVDLLREDIKSKGVLGELEHPSTMNIRLENVSHMIESIEMGADGTVTGTIKLLDTPKGKIAKAIIEGGAPLYISSRGAGNIDECGNVTLTSLVTYDLVGTPGFSQAKLTKDGKKFESLNESLETPCWMIIESEEEDDDDKTKKGEGDEGDNADDKAATDDNKPADKSDDDNTDDNKTDDIKSMSDITKAIEELGKKVDSLSAQLHIAQENYVPVNYNAIQEWIETEFSPVLEKRIQESQEQFVTQTVAPAIEKWVTEDFSSELQKWITEEYSPVVEQWVNEEYSAMVQKWITEEYTPVLEKWITEEYSNELQSWITEQYTPVVEKWITEEYGTEQMNKLNENLSDYLDYVERTKQGDKYGKIDKMLEMLTDKNNLNETASKILEEHQLADKYASCPAVANMPANYRPLWEGLSDERKDKVVRASRMYDFTKQGVLETFWASQDLTAERIDENRQTQQPQTTPNRLSGYFSAAAKLRG